MDEKAFCYWLQGFFEMVDPKNLTEAQVKMIKEHLALVFQKVTPPLQKGVLLDSPGKGGILDQIIGPQKPFRWPNTGRGGRYC